METYHAGQSSAAKAAYYNETNSKLILYLSLYVFHEVACAIQSAVETNRDINLQELVVKALQD